MDDAKRTAPKANHRRAVEDLPGYAYFQGDFLPLADVKVSIATHALQYGTGCFEGIRAYYNPKQEQLYVLKMREHYKRIHDSCRILQIDPGHSIDDMCDITLQLLRMNEYREDVYIRPIAFKADLGIGLKLSGLHDAFAIYCLPLGDYIDTAKGLHCCVSSWIRPDDNMIPVRAKVTGAYINACLASDDARRNGFDEAIMLTADDHVSEASSANIFLLRNGKLITPAVTEAILEGITRSGVIQMAINLGFTIEERRVDRTELYVAEEIFLVGTGVQVSPVTRIDHRPVGTGRPGPVALRIQETYFRAVRGEDPTYRDWLWPVFER